MVDVGIGDKSAAAAIVFKHLVGPRLAEKYKAIDLLDESLSSVDVVLLKSLILNAIRGEFAVGREVQEGDESIADTRSWLLNSLGRLSAEDDAVTEEVVRHLARAYEPSAWARYWALEGLIVSKNKRLPDIAANAAKDAKDPLVSTLALAYRASSGDVEARGVVTKRLSDPETQWSALRALRVVPLQSTVDALCELVDSNEYRDEVYDAIVAVGRVPSSSTHAPRAAQVLGAAIVKMRGKPWKDGMRTGAIVALGNLRVESSGPLLLEELTDDNPAVVREAARSGEKILGLATMVIRVVEAAVKNQDPVALEAYGRALRWRDRGAVANELANVMASSGSAVHQEMSRALLSELGGAVAFEKLRVRTAAMKQYGEVLERAEQKVRELFETSVHEAQRGFHLATMMDVAVFVAGMILIAGSAVVALGGGQASFAAWAGVGTAGILGVLYSLLLANPRRQVREAVDHLMRVKIVFLGYLRQLHQADQAYTRRMLEETPITVEQVKGYTDIVGAIMDVTAKHLAIAPLVDPKTRSK